MNPLLPTPSSLCACGHTAAIHGPSDWGGYGCCLEAGCTCADVKVPRAPSPVYEEGPTPYDVIGETLDNMPQNAPPSCVNPRRIIADLEAAGFVIVPAPPGTPEQGQGPTP